jgi:L,D-peptidoglycan transpeptidase YkuD (ErfK/YbiS/YcfS/YnhG family)
MRNRMIWTDEHDRTALAMRRKGKSHAEIGWVLGVSAKSVSERLRRLGLRQTTGANERRKVVKVEPSSIETEAQIRSDRHEQIEACERHAQAVMAVGGFCAFSDSGDKRSPFGIARPLVWPAQTRRAA